MTDTDPKVLRAQIEQIDTLPTIPSVLQKLLKLIENPKVSLTEVGSFIQSDPVLTSRVLKMVNSPIYGFPGRISAVQQALILLGLNVVRGLLLGVSVFEVMQKSMVGLWDHSLGCAIASRIIAKKKGLPEPEEISIAGLLHDIGKVVLILRYKEDYDRVMKESDARDLFVVESEKEVFGITHADAGAWIAKKWNFPLSLVEIIDYHHKPNLSKSLPVQAAIVHLGDILTRSVGFGFSGDYHVPAVNPAAWELLNLSNSDLREILDEMDGAFSEAETFLIGDES
jgi:putative nucleotidyltransferase with HDIG domain